MGKFNEIYEEVYQRFEKTSAIPGDYVKIRSNVKSSDWYKNLDEARKGYVDNIIALQEAGKFILFSSGLVSKQSLRINVTSITSGIPIFCPE